MLEKTEHIDYLAELVVSQLIASGKVKDSEVYFHCLGVFKRFFSKDVEKIVIRKNENGKDECNVFINREGLYDLLPEGFFHSHAQKYFKDRRETIREFRQHKKEEKSARQFFIPLDREFLLHLVNKEVFEQNIFYAPETVTEFIDFFNLNDLGLNMYQQASLFFILPHISKIAGNISLTETCFEIILQERVSLKTFSMPLLANPDQNKPGLGQSILGYSAISGNFCCVNNPGILIEIGPLLDSSSLMNYLNGTRQDLINRLIDLFIQADLTTKVDILLNEENRSFVFGQENFEARLNYSTTI